MTLEWGEMALREAQQGLPAQAALSGSGLDPPVAVPYSELDVKASPQYFLTAEWVEACLQPG